VRKTAKQESKKRQEPAERTYTCQQVAEILGLPFETVIELCDTNLLGHRDIGPRSERYTLRMISQSQLDDFKERIKVSIV
jgi:hypothetical protein